MLPLPQQEGLHFLHCPYLLSNNDMPGIVLQIFHMFFPILTTTFTEETSENKFKNSRQPDFQAQANSITATHSPSPHSFPVLLEKTEDLGVIGRSRFLSWWYSYLAYVIFKLLTYSHLFEGSLLVSQPRYQTVGSLDPNGHLIPVPNSLSFPTFTLKCLMSQNIDFSVMYKKTRPASNSVATLAACGGTAERVLLRKVTIFLL